MEGNYLVSTSLKTEDQSNVQDRLLCNICDLEPLRDPVVTSCGHLYCWPCLEGWLQNQSQKRCRACATPLTYDSNFVKLYGTGSDSQVLEEQSDSTVLECRICLESLPSTNAVATSCGHVFCWPCLYRWLDTHHRAKRPCPICRNVLMRDVNILPLYGSREGRSGDHGPVNVGTGAEATNSSGLFIPPRPGPPGDASALSSRTYATSDDELESDDEQESDDENDRWASDFDRGSLEVSSDDGNDDMSTSEDESDDDSEEVLYLVAVVVDTEAAQGVRRYVIGRLRRERLQTLSVGT